MNIVHIADLHISGKTFDRCKVALFQVSEYLNDIDIVVFSGDVFDRYNIADRFRTVGELQGLLLQLINSHPSIQFRFLVGNHDRMGIQKSALEFLKHINNCKVIDEVCNEGDLGYLPWQPKSMFIENPNLKIDTLNILSGAKFVFGHIELHGAELNGGYKLHKDLSITYSKEDLLSIGAELIRLGHIHKRDEWYTGSLYQTNFGEAGNLQGFDIIRDGVLEYISLDLPTYATIDIYKESDLSLINDSNINKLRVYDASIYQLIDCDKYEVVERLWGKREHVGRTEMSVSVMNESDLLQEYIKLNPLDSNLNINDLLEVL